MHRAFLCLVFGLAPMSLAAQTWTTDWEARSEDGTTHLTGDRAAHAAVFVDMLEEASAWFASMGFRAPDLERSPTNPDAYLVRVKRDTSIVSSTNYNPSARPTSSMWLTGNLGMTSPTTATERLMWASPVHELLHAVMWRYDAFERTALPTMRPNAPRLDRCPDGTDATLIGWFNEGASSVLQVRWYERKKMQSQRYGRRAYGHPFTDPGVAAWVRHFDQPIHSGRVPPAFQNKNAASYQAERAAGRSWRCGYGTWPFWYFVGDQLAKEPGQEGEYLRYILEQPSGWERGALEAVDNGLKAAAAAFGSPNRVNDGLYELYPAFIAEYADTTAFYERPVALDLRGRSEVKWHDGSIEPMAATAFEVSINVDDNATQTSRFRVTLDPQDGRDQLHLIAGQTVYRQGEALADEDPYSVEIPVLRDTTILVRLANVAEEAKDTEGLNYAMRFELGGFYGAEASDPYTAPDVDIPPGFSVMSGPPELVGCSGGADGGSVFDLITAAEAVGDIRRAEGNANQMLTDMDEALEDGEFPMPGATPAEREAMQSMIESGAISEAQIAEMRAMIAEAQAEMEGYRPEIDEAKNELASEYRGRSRLIANFVGTAGNQTCQVLLAAGLRGEEGGAQQLSVADDSDLGEDDPLAVGIESVGYLVGSSIQEMMMADDAYSICMMTPEEQAREQRSSCPTVCSGGASSSRKPRKATPRARFGQTSFANSTRRRPLSAPAWIAASWWLASTSRLPTQGRTRIHSGASATRCSARWAWTRRASTCFAG